MPNECFPSASRDLVVPQPSLQGRPLVWLMRSMGISVAGFQDFCEAIVDVLGIVAPKGSPC